jgi:hypothetical protein
MLVIGATVVTTRSRRDPPSPPEPVPPEPVPPLQAAATSETTTTAAVRRTPRTSTVRHRSASWMLLQPDRNNVGPPSARAGGSLGP